jgi:hypothetical protein
MVIQYSNHRRRRETASLMVELLVAIALLTGALLPIAFSIGSEKRLARTIYERAIAMEIVDGELEVLAAGEWKALSPGSHPYQPKGAALTNLPKGEFFVRIDPAKIRLEWISAKNPNHAAVVREIAIKPSGADANTPEQK